MDRREVIAGVLASVGTTIAGAKVFAEEIKIPESSANKAPYIFRWKDRSPLPEEYVARFKDEWNRAWMRECGDVPEVLILPSEVEFYQITAPKIGSKYCFYESYGERFIAVGFDTHQELMDYIKLTFPTLLEKEKV